MESKNWKPVEPEPEIKELIERLKKAGKMKGLTAQALAVVGYINNLELKHGYSKDQIRNKVKDAMGEGFGEVEPILEMAFSNKMVGTAWLEEMGKNLEERVKAAHQKLSTDEDKPWVGDIAREVGSKPRIVEGALNRLGLPYKTDEEKVMEIYHQLLEEKTPTPALTARISNETEIPYKRVQSIIKRHRDELQSYIKLAREKHQKLTKELGVHPSEIILAMHGIPIEAMEGLELTSIYPELEDEIIYKSFLETAPKERTNEKTLANEIKRALMRDQRLLWISIKELKRLIHFKSGLWGKRKIMDRSIEMALGELGKELERGKIKIEFPWEMRPWKRRVEA